MGRKLKINFVYLFCFLLIVFFQNCSLEKSGKNIYSQSSTVVSEIDDVEVPKLSAENRDLTYLHDMIKLRVSNMDTDANYTWFLNDKEMNDMEDLPVAPNGRFDYIVPVLKIHEGQYYVVVEKNGQKKVSNKVNIRVSYPTSCFVAHLGNLQKKIPSEDRDYMIDFDGKGPGAPVSVYCLNSIEDGGWMRVSYRDAIDRYFGRIVVIEDGIRQQLTENRGPRTRDNDGNSHHYFEFKLPHSIGQFMLVDFQVRANAADGNTSEIIPENFTQSKWLDAYGGSSGDIAFGNPNRQSVAYSLAQDNITIDCEKCITTVNTGPIGLSSTKEFRISFSEAGQEREGWRPWYGGDIYVR